MSPSALGSRYGNCGPPSLRLAPRLTFETGLAVCKPLEGVTPGQRLHSHLSAHITLIDAVHLRFEQKLMVDILEAALAQVHDVSFEPYAVLDLPDVRNYLGRVVQDRLQAQLFSGVRRTFPANFGQAFRHECHRVCHAGHELLLEANLPSRRKVGPAIYRLTSRRNI